MISSKKMNNFNIEVYLRENRELIDSYLKTYFQTPSYPSLLQEAIKYSIFAGGKRIRPILALTSYKVCGGDPKDILPQAAALELIHTYSLIHDDLPAMDNDELRRGKPTNHKIFGEAIAILAGDALITEAFFMMTINFLNGKRTSPASVMKAIREIALSAGAYGMVGGQAQDIISENMEPDRDTLNFIHLHKTAALITASVRIGPILADSDEGKLKALTIYGENIGLAFQIVDDILDIEGVTEELGKPSGSDKRKKKMTYPSLLGMDRSKQKAKQLISQAIDELRIFSSEADPLREIANYLMVRRA
jgi:geranylgeranyl diphosphate synthase type II